MAQDTIAVKALTLWQPWASFVVHGIKRYETRSWSTTHRGLLAIHAAKRPIPQTDLDRFSDLLIECGYERPDMLPYGQIVGFVDVVSVHPVEQIRDTIDERERRLGNYLGLRHAWKLANPRYLPWTFDSSMVRTGKQRLWATTVPKIYAQHVCQHDGCLCAVVTECVLPGRSQEPDIAEYYCPDHCFDYGYCYMCGHFYAGMERFDFSQTHLCPDCEDEIRHELGEDDEFHRDEWLAQWEEYPGDLLATDIDFDDLAKTGDST